MAAQTFSCDATQPVEAVEPAPPPPAAPQTESAHRPEGRRVYTLAIIATAIATALRWAVDPLVDQSAQYLFFYFSVVLVAVEYGLRAGLFAILLGAGAGTWLFVLLGHSGPEWTDDITRLILFLLFGGFTMLVARRLWATRNESASKTLQLHRSLESLQRIEQALRESERRYRIVAEHPYDWEFWRAPSGEFIHNSPSCFDVTGYAPEAFQVDPDLFRRIIHPDDRNIYELHRGPDPRLCASPSAEFRIVRRDGQIRWIAHNCKAVFEDGEFLGIRGTNRDITERKEAEQLLLKEKVFADSVINSLPGIFYLFCEDSVLLRWNRSLEAVTGYSSQEISVMKPLDFFDPEDKPVISVAIKRVFEVGTANVEGHIKRKDGTRVLFYFVGDRMVIDGVPYVVGTGMDITERRRIEAELASARHAAEAAKTAEEKASRAKDHFMAVLSHELRTPLTPVLAALSILEEQALEGATRETLEVIQRNVEMEARLIDDLLDVTRIARGKVQLDKRPIELCRVLDRAIEVCKPDLENRNLRFGLDLGAAPYWINADGGRLQQVFWNLIKNAVKFTPKYGRIGVRCRPHQNGSVIVEVSDSGVGIAPEAMGRIFNAFEQAEHATARQFGGLGLGLTISKALVELHGGDITAQSGGHGKGATFTVRLPTIAPGEIVSVKPQQPAKGAGASGLPSMKVLLVEDHGDSAVAIRRLLERLGHKVQTAGDIATGLELVGKEPFNLIISDLGLPDGSGLDLMGKIRARGLAVKGIALSGYGMEEDIRRSHEAGFSDHLTKPIDLRTLRAAIARASVSPAGRTGRARLLLVEDHADTAVLLRQLLNGIGFDVECASCKNEALELARQHSYDVMLSDLSLPDGNGRDLMKELRRRGATFAGVAISGYAEPEDCEQSMRAGFSEHLKKPVDMDELEAVLTRVTSELRRDTVLPPPVSS